MASRPVPLVDLTRQHRVLKRQLARAVDRVLASGNYILGPEVAAFERAFARQCDTRYAIGVASGTDALELALRACGIGPGDEVITSPLTFIATAEAIIAAGARPVFADINLVSYTLDPAQARQVMTKRTKAVMPVHLFGQPAELPAFVTLARHHRLRLIEDCAQAIGATYDGRPVGSWGDAGCFSFFPTKNIGACGDGGAVVTNSRRLAERISMLRVHGTRRKYYHEVYGKNSRLDELQAAILRIKLKRLRRWNARRSTLARQYGRLLRQRGTAARMLPCELPGRRHVHCLYVIRTAQRGRLQAACQRQGIATAAHYATPLHLQPALRWLGYRRGSFPQAERVASELVALPLFPELTFQEMRRVLTVVRPYLTPP